MMKTPDEIKKGLANYRQYTFSQEQLYADALAYIHQLENHIGELTEKVALLEAAQPKWISVEERLPEQFVPVLVYMPDESPFPTVHEGYLRPDGKWDAAHYTRTPDEVTHWANMPEPPEVNA